MNILITGASGFIGLHLLQACIDSGHRVTACVRNVTALRRFHPDIKTLYCDFSKDHEVHDWLPRLDNIDAVINAVGIFRQRGRTTFDALHTKTPRALFKACEIKGVKKVVQLSALGADDTAFSEYHLSKKAADDFLTGLDLDWTIVMPSIVYGSGAASMRLFRALAALPVTPLVGSGEQQIQPIHIDDLTAAVLRLIEYDTGRQRIEAVGPQPITVAQLYVSLKSWFGFSGRRFVKVPLRSLLLFARIAERVGHTPISVDALKMLQKGNTADVKSFISKVGFTPISLEHALRRQPPLAGDYLDAKLYFLLPLLKFTLAVLWIATGLISAFVYPTQSSYEMLNQVGIAQPFAPAALYGAAALDVCLGVALLWSYHLRLVVYLQILIMLAYSLFITIGMAELWLHPFGPVSKNIPLIIATLMLLAREK